eukprot:CAMPEP_0177653894 /NCGR_PEP_ID=MMETSP0447-20121125/13996_1 /TAXON_ID=0 /ORGANISM="Stygamoeba regulata, Strain BSH-02190019" /LENGTH=174 /DNA_ID=CAMNT_0019157415 /DNA_START=413 /DNA_END=934 /DNA_ORIENTATION=-
MSLGNAFYRGADAVILVYDVTNKRSFDNLQNWMQEFLVQGVFDSPTFPFIVVANKVDREDKRVVSRETAKEWCQAQNCACYIETSAKSGVNVDTAFREASKAALKQSPPPEEDNVMEGLHNATQPLPLDRQTQKDESDDCPCFIFVFSGISFVLFLRSGASSLSVSVVWFAVSE